MLDGVLAYLQSEEGKLRAGDPPLTRVQRRACKGLPKWADLRKLARVWLEFRNRTHAR